MHWHFTWCIYSYPSTLIFGCGEDCTKLCKIFICIYDTPDDTPDAGTCFLIFIYLGTKQFNFPSIFEVLGDAMAETKGDNFWQSLISGVWTIPYVCRDVSCGRGTQQFLCSVQYFVQSWAIRILLSSEISIIIYHCGSVSARSPSRQHIIAANSNWLELQSGVKTFMPGFGHGCMKNCTIVNLWHRVF